MFIESTSISNSGGNTTGNRTQNVPLPPNRLPGDLMLMVTTVYNGNLTAAPTGGWTYVNASAGSNRPRHTVNYRIVDGTEGPTTTATVSVSDSVLFTILLFRGVNQTTPLGAYASTDGAASATHTTPSITTTSDTAPDHGLVLRVAQSYRNTGSNAYSWPVGVTEIIDNQAVTSGDTTLSTVGMATAPAAAVGAQGAVAATFAASQVWNAFTLAINPAP